VKRVKILCQDDPAHIVGWVSRDVDGRFVVEFRAYVADGEGALHAHPLNARFVEGLHPATGAPVPDYHVSAEAKCPGGRVCRMDFDRIVGETRRGARVVRVPFVSDPV